MVEKIYVRPEEVRGLGNIVIPKSLEDYETYESVLVEGSDEVYGTVYTMSYNHVPDFDEIVLSSDKDILSYNGGTNPDVAVLTAQLTNAEEPVAVSGETVTFEVHKQSDDSLIETLTGETDSSGKATVSYTSKGAGDLYIKSNCAFVSKTYSIKDAIKYIQGSVTTGALSNISSIPTNFKCTFKVKQTSTTSSFVGVFVGANSTNRILFGKTGSNGQLGVIVYNNGSSVASATQNSVYQNNVEAETVYTYEDGVQTLTANNVTKTLTNSSITDRSYNYIEVTNSQCSDLIIEPL